MGLVQAVTDDISGQNLDANIFYLSLIIACQSFPGIDLYSQDYQVVYPRWKIARRWKFL